MNAEKETEQRASAGRKASECSELLSVDELNLLRQWFNVMMDCHDAYLETADYKLGLKITEMAGGTPCDKLLRRAR